MFPRQEKLTPILTSLSWIYGVNAIRQDDWDSAGINVFLDLTAINTNSDGIQKFQASLGTIKASIKGICRRKGVRFNFLHWPSIKYRWDSFDKKKVPVAYDCGHIKLEVFV